MTIDMLENIVQVALYWQLRAREQFLTQHLRDLRLCQPIKDHGQT